MNLALLGSLRCPRTGTQFDALDVNGQSFTGGSLDDGWLVARGSGERYPVRRGIARFVPASNYADNFGMQWNRFRHTQLDSHSGHPISANRFWTATGWSPIDLRDRWVLDVGCGAGRFAEVALGAGAHVVALDYSSAVDACAANLQARHPRLHVVQGDIYQLPFAPGSFDAVYSLGVLQHTPNVESAFLALPNMIKSGGAFCVDFYGKSWKSTLLPKYWLRPLTKRLPKAQLFALLESSVPALLGASDALAAVPALGRLLRRVVPVANYRGELPLSAQQLREWALLDTFDWLAPTYDQPQTPKTVQRWLQAADLDQPEVLHAGHLVARGRRK